MHPTTKAIVDAIVATGVSVSGGQQSAMDAFVKAEIAAGRWGTVHKHFYFPVWGVAAANAINWVSLSSGTFFATVTHGAGFAKANGSSGYFSFGQSPDAAGLTVQSGSLWALVTASPTVIDKAVLGVYDSFGKNIIWYQSTTTTMVFQYSDGTAGFGSFPYTQPEGIICSGRHGGSMLAVQRTSSGVVTRRNVARADAGIIPTTPMEAWRLSIAGRWSDVSMGGFGMGTGMSIAEMQAFTLNAKTLWETVTGLTLP